MDYNISESEKFMAKYNDLLQKVKSRFHGSYCEDIRISHSKASRVLNGQFDIITLIKMASFVGYSCDLCFNERVNF